jgi:glutamine amidotransferase-like uncharacterized protein
MLLYQDMRHKKSVAIYLNHPTCSVDSVNGILAALSLAYKIKIFTKQKIPIGFFDDVDLVVFPGGTGEAVAFHSQLKLNIREIRNFIKRGGKYLGICMGAYWADEYFFGFLKQTRVVQHIKRPRAWVKSSYGTCTPVEWQGTTRQMYFFDGPTFTGGGFETIASYANGDPMAIIQGQIALIGCHLESEENWYHKKTMQAHWHHGDHHQLLLKFIDDFLHPNPQFELF